MKISVKVKVGAKKEGVKEVGEGKFEVAVSAPPEKGRANAAVVKALAEYFKVSQTDIMLVSGQTSKYKIVEISN